MDSFNLMYFLCTFFPYLLLPLIFLLGYLLGKANKPEIQKLDSEIVFWKNKAKELELKSVNLDAAKQEMVSLAKYRELENSSKNEIASLKLKLSQNQNQVNQLRTNLKNTQAQSPKPAFEPKKTFQNPKTQTPNQPEISSEIQPEIKPEEVVQNQENKNQETQKENKPKPSLAKKSPQEFDAKLAQEIFGKKIKADDLKLIEGIGPKIEQLFKEENITSWKILSNTPITKCQEILDKAGPRYKMHNPKTWPLQASLAAEGNFQELKALQDKI
ncbi:MAG: hypothetical protein C4K58_04205 [Flavobacteriaceae bacterium]|nr:MAG: hypothetical protein C4K58_04205 [Flavobacteriaceae bacterium]